MTENAPQLQQPGRNFLEAVKGVKSYDREKAMQEDDYIEMPWKDFGQWVATQPSGETEDKTTFPTEGDVRVIVKTISREKDKPTRIVVKADGIERKVDASLFFNYGYNHGHDEVKAVSSSRGSLWDERNAG